MKHFLSIVLSLTALVAFCQTAEMGRPVSQILSRYSTSYSPPSRTNRPYVNTLQTAQTYQPTSMTLSGNVAISGMTFNLLSASNALYIGIDPVNGSDSREPYEYTVQTSSFTGGVVFKTLDKAIEWMNASSGYYYYVSIRNSSSSNPVVLSSGHEVNNKYVSFISANYPTPAYMVLNAGLFASTGTIIQLGGLDLTLNGSNRIILDGGDFVIMSSTIRPSASCSNLYYLALGKMYLDNSTYVFSANNQSLIQPSGGYGAQVSVGMHGPLVFTMGAYTGLSLISPAHRGYNLSVKCKDTATFPSALNIEGGIFQYGQTLVQGQAVFDPTNSNYKSVLHGLTPIRTPDMTSNSENLVGNVKTVVVDENGRFGVHGNRFTTAQRDALTPYEGLEIYNLTTHAKEFWNGTTWKTILTN
ncbi:hypothetical protein [Spirosoma sp.]|uniref:hypothetical protein n=1 Tax=Spirosoma sp. TaxID=1899569 RepID=UPI003B3A0EF4